MVKSCQVKLKTKCHKKKQQLKLAAVKSWQSITREETQSLVMSVGSRHQTVIDCKGLKMTI